VRILDLGFALAAAAALLAGCKATRVGTTSTLQETVETYRESDEKKALALAVDERGRKAWGAQFGSLTQGSADDDAMEECRAAAQHRSIEARCYLFASGNRQARSTVEGCREGRIGRKRCAAQEAYAPLLEP
jgi:hypothetical protein